MSESAYFWLITAGELSLTFFAFFMLFLYAKKYLAKIDLGFDSSNNDAK
ncbi:MAG: hypothetical protein L3J28_05015 [Candidatus Polarisedimenticolaceae bacterium]|nr:hypothetical protein [Candidatus Polarisedimenticolaceae bacterium]